MSKCSHMTQWLAGRNLRLSILILFSEIPYIAKTGKKRETLQLMNIRRKNEIKFYLWYDFNILISGFKEISFIYSTFSFFD